jgi:hypothetical protein
MITTDELANRLANPTETAQQELKGWFDPTTPEGSARLAKACIALRNRNGGLLILGVHDKTRKISSAGWSPALETAYSSDAIQALIGKYSTDLFEIETSFHKIGRKRVLTIEVPTGVKYPAMARRDIQSATEPSKRLLKANTVYVRTVRANHTFSSSEASPDDLKEVVDICFDNRESDSARFLRRHFPEIETCELPKLLQRVLGVSTSNVERAAPVGQSNFLDDSFHAFEKEVAHRGLVLPRHGSREVSCEFVGDFVLPEDFMYVVKTANPNLSGWPTWLDTRSFNNALHRAYKKSGMWESLIVAIGQGTLSDRIDFIRQSPAGKFYHYRALEDDMNPKRVKPLSELEWVLCVLRVAEAIAVGINFAKAFKLDESGSLDFTFRWRGLESRALTSWANPGRSLSYDRHTREDVITSRIVVPSNAAQSTVSKYTTEATRPLFLAFEDFVLAPPVIDGVVTGLLERRSF